MTAMTSLCLSIFAGGVAQVVLRRGMSVGHSQTSARSANFWIHMLRSPWLWAYGFCFVAALGLWIIALSQTDISFAFPMLSASYILVALLSRVLLKESVGRQRWIAIAVITIGVFIIAKN